MNGCISSVSRCYLRTIWTKPTNTLSDAHTNKQIPHYHRPRFLFAFVLVLLCNWNAKVESRCVATSPPTRHGVMVSIVRALNRKRAPNNSGIIADTPHNMLFAVSPVQTHTRSCPYDTRHTLSTSAAYVRSRCRVSVAARCC